MPVVAARRKARVAPGTDADALDAGGRLMRQKETRHLPRHASDGPDIPGGDPTQQTARNRIWEFMENPQSSTGAWLWSVSMLSLIIVSCGAFVLETHPLLCCGRYDHVWQQIELVCIVAFTIEYCVRFYVCPLMYGARPNSVALRKARRAATLLAQSPTSTWSWQVLKEEGRCRLRFAFSPLNLIDAIAILPFYIEAILTALGVELDLGTLRIIRLVRVFRLLKLGKYNEGLQLLAVTMQKSIPALLMLSFVLTIALVICSAIVYMIERGTWCGEDSNNKWCDGSVSLEQKLQLQSRGAKGAWFYGPGDHEESTTFGCGAEAAFCRSSSEFYSIPHALYWSTAAITTTGYGDLHPRTWLGKAVACIIMCSGLLLLALPITVISGNFATVYAEKELLKIDKTEQLQESRDHLDEWSQRVDALREQQGAAGPPSETLGAQVTEGKGGSGRERDEGNVCGSSFGVYEERSDDRVVSAHETIIGWRHHSGEAVRTSAAADLEPVRVSGALFGDNIGSGDTSEETGGKSGHAGQPREPGEQERATLSPLRTTPRRSPLARFRDAGKIVASGSPLASSRFQLAGSALAVKRRLSAAEKEADEFEMELNRLLKEHQTQLFSRLERLLTGASVSSHILIPSFICVCLWYRSRLERSLARSHSRSLVSWS